MVSNYPTVYVSESVSENCYEVFLGKEYLGSVLFFGSVNELTERMHPESILKRVAGGNQPTDTELEIITRLA